MKDSLDCFVVPPRNDAKRRKRKATKKLNDAHYWASQPDPLRVIARNEAIQIIKFHVIHSL